MAQCVRLAGAPDEKARNLVRELNPGRRHCRPASQPLDQLGFLLNSKNSHLLQNDEPPQFAWFVAVRRCSSLFVFWGLGHFRPRSPPFASVRTANQAESLHSPTSTEPVNGPFPPGRSVKNKKKLAVPAQRPPKIHHFSRREAPETFSHM